MRRPLLILAVLLALAATSAPALAAPRITGLEVYLPVEDEPATVVVEARDPDAPLSGVRVERPGLGAFTESACRTGRGRGPFGDGAPARFEVPLPGEAVEGAAFRVTVYSGGCSDPQRASTVDSTLALTPGPVPSSSPFTPLPALPIARAAASCRGADTIPRGRTRRTVRLAIACLINAERRARGLRTLRVNRRLQKAAYAHSIDMRRREYFAHVTPDGVDLADRLKRVRYWPARGGENLAAGTGSLSTPRITVAGWMKSEAHRLNMLERAFREIGIGVVTEFPVPPEAPGGTFTANFGVRG